MTDREDLRRPAKITGFELGPEDHGIITVVIRLESPTGGWGQGFGCLRMKDDAEAKRFLGEVCAIFDHSEPERLKGQECIALYCLPWESIEGIEAPSGKRFTITGWRRRYYPEHTLSPTGRRRKALKENLQCHRRRVTEIEAQLDNLEHLIDWDVEP
jgi:hypothetical protein